MSKMIFVVDDSAVSLAETKEALKNQYQVMTFISAARMFEAIDNVSPDLILLDIEMPDVNGFDVLTKLKEGKKTAHIPVVLLTSMTDNMSIVLGASFGAVDYIMKPFTPSELLRRVQKKI